MRRVISGLPAAMLALVVAAGVARADVGDLKPAKVLPDDLISIYSQSIRPATGFAKPAEGAGTVNARAMVAVLPGSKIRCAIDAADAEATSPNVIRFDFTGQGKFDAKAVVPLRLSRTSGGTFFARFGPADVPVTMAGRSFSARVAGFYQKFRSGRYLACQVHLAVAGQCLFGDKAHLVRVIDGDGNLRFNDASRTVRRQGSGMYVMQGDTVIVETGDARPGAKVEKVLYGQPVRVDGRWYDVTVSADGKRVSAKPYAGPMGSIHVPHGDWWAVLVGRQHVLSLEGGQEPTGVPADTYVIWQYVESAPVGSVGAKAKLTAFAFSDPTKMKEFAVQAGQTVELPAGSPVKADLVISRPAAGTLMFSLRAVDSLGMPIAGYSVPGQAPEEPQVEIVDAAGATVATFKMAYG